MSPTGSLRQRTPRYQDFVDGVRFTLTVTGTDHKTAIKIYCETLESADKLETQVNSYKAANSQTEEKPGGEYVTLDYLIETYINCRLNNANMPEWMIHSGVSRFL